MENLFKGVVKLPDYESFETLKTTGHLTIGGITIDYSPKDTLYVIPENGEGTNDYDLLQNKPITNADLSSLTTITTNQTYRHTGTTTSSFVQYKLYTYNGTSWSEIGAGGGGNVTSVNGYTGVVVLDADDIDDSGTSNKFVSESEKNSWDEKSTVGVSATGTATDEVQYITIDGVEKKLAGGSTITTTDKIEQNNTNPVTSGGLYNIFHSKRYW